MMKKTLFLFVLLTIVFAEGPKDYEREILHTIFSAIKPDTPFIYLYSNEPKRTKELFMGDATISVISEAEKADILLFFHGNGAFCRYQKPIVAVGRLTFKQCKGKVAAAFYWFKGRPNVVFCHEWLQEHNLTLPPSLHPFVDRCRVP